MPLASTLLLVSLAAPPGPLADLDAALARFTAREPLRARFTHRFDSTNGEGKDLVRNQGEVGGEVAEGEAGLEIIWPRDLLDRAREEEQRRAADPEAKTPVRDGIAAVDAMALAGYLDAAAGLRQALDGAKLLEDRPDVLDGAPVRLLVLDVKPALSTRDRRYVKDVEASLRVWLGSDGLPVAAEERAKASGRVMLVVSFRSEQSEAWRFELAGDRLVAVRHETSRQGEGAGEKSGRRTTTVLVPLRNGGR